MGTRNGGGGGGAGISIIILLINMLIQYKTTSFQKRYGVVWCKRSQMGQNKS